VRLDLSQVIKEGHQPQAWRRALGLRGGLVIAEVAMAFTLAVGAGLLTRSYTSLLQWDPGFERRGLLTFWTYASTGSYPDRERVTGLFERIEAELGAIPSVTSVGMTSAGPLFGGGDGAAEFTVERDPVPIVANWYDMSPGYFMTLGLALRTGRWFDAADRAGSRPVAIVNEALARRWFAGRSPVGARLTMKKAGEPMEIVGVVADIPPFKRSDAAVPEIYWPYAQSPRWASYFVLRTGGDPAALARIVDARLRAVDPDLSPGQLATMEDLVDSQLKRPRFAAMTLVLTTVGVYGVMAAAVAGRTRELGVRVALGASGRRVVGMVMREGMALSAAGMALGAVISLAVSRFAAALLFGVRPADPLTFGGVGLLLTVVTATACFVPARRAARVDPTEALRAEG
jgi:predicted permease